MAATELRSRLSLRQRSEQRLSGMKVTRYSWWVHWRELADYILPRRYRWLVTPNQMNRGAPLNGLILDSTGTLAAGYCASGIMHGVTSPSRTWFKLLIDGLERDGSSAGAIWLDQVESRMQRVLQESNFYNSIAVCWKDIVVFGTGVMLIYEDYEDVIRCYNPCLGEFYLSNSYRININCIYREYNQNVAQVVERFGIEKVSDSVREAYRLGGSALQREVTLCSGVEPNEGEISDRFAFREVCWDRGDSGDRVLEVRGFFEFPGIAVRWDVEGNDAYGRGPGMDALPDIKQLQQETKRKAQAIDKQVNPPLIADTNMKNQPATVIPGGVTYVPGLTQTNNPGMRPMYLVQPQIEHMSKDIAEVQVRVGRALFNDLFLMISQLQTVRSATEIDARREEKLVMLGPVLERLENEGLDPALRRVYAVMQRGGLFPPVPEAIRDAPIKIQYISMLAQAQRAAATASIERVLGLAGNLLNAFPEIKDNIDPDAAIREYGADLGVTPILYHSPDQVAAIREGRNAAMQQQIQAAQLKELAAGAKTLSETDLNANNALAALTGGG